MALGLRVRSLDGCVNQEIVLESLGGIFDAWRILQVLRRRINLRPDEPYKGLSVRPVRGASKFSVALEVTGYISPEELKEIAGFLQELEEQLTGKDGAYL